MQEILNKRLTLHRVCEVTSFNSTSLEYEQLRKLLQKTNKKI